MIRRSDVARCVVVLLAMVTLVMGGCARVQRPSAQIVGAAVTEQTDEGARIELALHLVNRNDIVLPLATARYRVSVEDVGTFSVAEEPAVALPPNAAQTLTLAAAFAHGQNGDDWHGRRYEIYGTVSYRPPGQLRELLEQYNIPLPVAQFSSEGTLQTNGQPAAPPEP